MSHAPAAAGDAGRSAAKMSSQMEAVMRVMTGREERTIAEKLADSNRPTWEQYKKDNEDKLDLQGQDQKKMQDYRRELDEQREKILSRGINHGALEKKRRKRKKKKKRRHYDSEEESSESESSSSAREKRHARRKKRRKKEKRRRKHHSSSGSDSSESESDSGRESDEDSRKKRKHHHHHKKKKRKTKRKSSARESDDDRYRLSSFFTKDSDSNE